MNKLLKEYKRNYIFLSIGYIVLGLLLLFFPETSGKIMCYILASFAAFFGITHLISYMNQKYPYETYRFDLVFGIIGIATGAIIFIKPELLLNFLPAVLGIIVFIDSIVKVQHAIDLKRMHFSSWWIVLVLALCMSGVGILMIMYPFSTFMTVVMFSGICLIVNALVNIYAITTLSRVIKSIHQEIENNLQENIYDAEVKETEIPSYDFDLKAEDIEKDRNDFE